MLEGFLERIYPFLSEILDENGIALRRKRFFYLVGDIREEEGFYSERMNAFLEWLLVDMDSQLDGDSLLSVILREKRGLLDDETRLMAEAMLKSRRSLFLIVRKEKEFAVLEDIFDGERFYVDPDPRIEISEKKSLVETRVFVLRGRSRIMSTYLRYPDRLKKIIIKQLKRLSKGGGVNKDKFLDYSMALYIRSERYRKVPVEKIADSLNYLLYGQSV